eukprot:194576-Rhodomonas_salina.1
MWNEGKRNEGLEIESVVGRDVGGQNVRGRDGWQKGRHQEGKEARKDQRDMPDIHDDRRHFATKVFDCCSMRWLRE